RLEKTRPPGAGVELRVRRKQRQAAADAGVDAVLLVVEQRAAERTLGPLRASDLVLLRRQLRAPFGVALLDAGKVDGPGDLAALVKHSYGNGGWHFPECYSHPLDNTN